MGTSEPRTCHACGASVAPRCRPPADGLSTCGPCRKAGVDPRDVEKLRHLELWLRDCVVPNPAAGSQPGGDVWGAYLAYVTLLDADNFIGRKRLLDLLEERGLGHRVGRTRYGGIDVTVKEPSASLDPMAAEAVAPTTPGGPPACP